LNKRLQHTALIISLLVVSFTAFSQTDTTHQVVTVDSLIKAAPPVQNKAAVDSVRRLHSPKKATIRSAILPGWGQAYNKKYWKIPIVYGALGIAGGIFLYNLNNYRDIRFAYNAKFRASQQGATLEDTMRLALIKPELALIDINSLRFYRDDFRRNIDFSVLAFIVLWGLNVVDATVDGHLKAFDVSPDLGFRFKLGPSQFAGTTGLSFVLVFK
jgi:hypothetical protein